MSIAIGSDHGGFTLKETLKEYLRGKGYSLEDYGTGSKESCDYPSFALPVAQAVASGKNSVGILICGTGIGMAIAANKVPGVRAAAVSEHFSAKYTRMHNDANILCLGERVTGPGLACEIAEIFLTSGFEGGRHSLRISMIGDIERKYMK